MRIADPGEVLEPAVVKERQPLRVRLLLRPEQLAGNEPELVPPSANRGRAMLAAIVILLVLGAGAAGYMSGSSGGGDVEAVRAESAAAGQAKGVAQGTREGRARGLESGRERGYAEAYPDAYRTAYREQFRAAGVAIPETVSVPGP